ncbi:MAG: Ppx/GppA family phosphatase [Solirubrobacteraceae bacterium]|nr:Ppx/GppA family phosphatase [Solirubrobacteraceae bacterium]
MPASEVITRRAVLDLGSNSFRLVVFESTPTWWRRSDEIREPVRLAGGVNEDGSLGKKAVERALDVLDVFAGFLRATEIEPDQVHAIGTSAIREATNQAEILRLAKEQCGIDIDVITREREAWYGYVAAINSSTLTHGTVLDIGGGSLQLTGVKKRTPLHANSWLLGAVRMTAAFLPPGGPVTRSQVRALHDHALKEFSRADWLGSTGSRLVGIGGAVRNLATASLDLHGHPEVGGAQGVVVDRDTLDELIEEMRRRPSADRARLRGIKPSRADIILAAAVVIAAAVEACGADAIEATEYGLREGVILAQELSGKNGPPGDDALVGKDTRQPLVDDVRRSGVENLLHRYDTGIKHVDHVTDLALSMFDQLVELDLQDPDPVERELLWAACQLHDIGMKLDYDDHHKHVRYILTKGGLPGFSPAETAVIAQACRYHRRGLPGPGWLAPLMGPGDNGRLQRIATLLRLAEGLERGRDGTVKAVQFKSTGNGSVQLMLKARGEAQVPMWAAARETEIFERAFGTSLEVGVG